MSEETAGKAFGDAVKNAQKITATEAVTEGLKGGVVAFVEGVGQIFDGLQASPTFNAWVGHGATEFAAAINHGAHGLAMYGWPHDQPKNDQPSPEVQSPEITPSHGLDAPEQQQSRGRSM